MRRKFDPRLTYANVAATLALILALTSPAWAGPAANGAATLKKTASKALGLGKKADKRARKASKKADTALKTAKQALAQDGKPGPQGGRGPTGATGPGGGTGATGSPAASAILGSTQTSTFLAQSDENLAPSGPSTPTGGSQPQLSPNATVVVRDLRVSIGDAPGGTASRTFRLTAGGVDKLTCTVGSTEQTCNTAAQTGTIAPGTELSLVSDATGTPHSTSALWGFRMTTP